MTLQLPFQTSPSARRTPFFATWGLERLSVVGVVALIVFPALVGGLLLLALWNPVGNLNRVTAAVVNDDVPVTVNGTTVPLGRQFANGLINGDPSAVPATGSSLSNFTWILTNDADAAAGLANGQYDAVLTIPADFSAAATSLSGPAANAVTATVVVQTSPAAAYVDPAFAQTLTTVATAALSRQVTSNYLDNIYLGFNTINTQIAQAATGAASVSSGAASVSSGAASLASGTASLQSGLASLSSGAASLSSGLDSLSSQTASLPAQTAQLAQGSAALAGGADAVANQLDATTTAVQKAVDEICAAPAPGPGNACTDARAALAKVEAANGAAAAFAAGANEVAAGNSALASAMPKVVGGIDESAAGAAQVAAGAAQASDGATSLNSGAASLADGASQVNDGAAQLSSGLATAVTQIPTYSESDRATLSAVASQPVTTDQLQPDPNLQSAPLFIVVALWIGALIVSLARRAVPIDELMTSASTLSIAARAARFVVIVGLAQGALIGLIAQVALHFDPVTLLAFVGGCMLAGAVFGLVNEALAAAFGAVGRLLCALTAVVAIAVGLTSAVPPGFTTIAGLLPTTSALTLARGAASGEVQDALLGLAGCLVFAAFAAVLLVGAVAARRTVRTRRLWVAR